MKSAMAPAILRTKANILIFPLLTFNLVFLISNGDHELLSPFKTRGRSSKLLP
jgi:hypothetical protein